MATVEATQAPVISNGTANGTADPEKHVQAEPPQTSEPEKTDSFDISKLPMSNEDGVLQMPFGKPFGTITPAVRPPLTEDQKTKYDSLLKSVSAWTEIPETSLKGAAQKPLSESERMWLTRECLLRYLRATKWNLAQAEIRVKKTLVWRREYKIEEHGPDYISPENETGKQVIAGWDKEGRTCLYLRPSKQNTAHSERQNEHMVFSCERCIELIPPGQETLDLLINFAETKQSQSVPLSQGKKILYILQDHYPERLGLALVTNLPWYINAFFKLISPFIDPVTRAKLKFNEDMTRFVPKEQLLTETGGLVELDYNHDIYWPALNALCDVKRSEYVARWKKAGSRIGEHEGYLKGGDEQSLAETEAATTPAEVPPASGV